MTDLLLIIVVLFAVLAMVVKFTEKHGQRLDNEQQSKLSRILIILIFTMLVARLIQYFVVGH